MMKVYTTPIPVTLSGTDLWSTFGVDPWCRGLQSADSEHPS